MCCKLSRRKKIAHTGSVVLCAPRTHTLGHLSFSTHIIVACLRLRANLKRGRATGRGQHRQAKGLAREAVNHLHFQQKAINTRALPISCWVLCQRRRWQKQGWTGKPLFYMLHFSHKATSFKLLYLWVSGASNIRKNLQTLLTDAVSFEIYDYLLFLNWAKIININLKCKLLGYLLLILERLVDTAQIT